LKPSPQLRSELGYAYVVGDILHAGHLLHLRNCKALCDSLVVGVLTDEAAMEKKPCPAIPFHERIQLIGALDCVDAAVPQASYSPETNVRSMKPDILFESQNHEPDEYAWFEGRVLWMPYYPETSSTRIKEHIRHEP
jgi:glycerol-3-phosphate cytidylyltransferase